MTIEAWTDEHALHPCLEEVVNRRFGGRSRIGTVEWEPFRLITSYDAYVLSVRLTTGEELKVFLKDFAVSARPKDAPEDRRRREVCAYRDLLAGAGLGSPEYYGSVFDPLRGRFWLLLEFVDGTPVGYCPLEEWPHAAGSLGRLHGHFSGRDRELESCDYLLRHEARFFWSRVDAAVESVLQIAPHLVGSLERVLEGYPAMVERMIAPPWTLVHGGCRPSNILIRVGSDPNRICILDWEEAGYGAPLFDLAHLLDGVEPPLLDDCLELYRKEAIAGGISPAPVEQMRYEIDCFRLHMLLNLLSQAALKGYRMSAVEKLLGMAERLAARLR